MALSILPHLMTTAAAKNGSGSEIVILTATSGDTGKAALAGFAGVKGTKIMVFYPKHGVSSIQERQMVTTVGANTRVIGINGNFDDAQTSVKNLFTDKALVEEMAQHGMQFSSANSINIGRLTPQIVYYVHAYCNLLKNEKISDGFFFTAGYNNMPNKLLLTYLLRCGIIAITLNTTGSSQNGIRVCISQLNTPEHFDILDERLAMFKQIVG